MKVYELYRYWEPADEWIYEGKGSQLELAIIIVDFGKGTPYVVLDSKPRDDHELQDDIENAKRYVRWERDWSDDI